MRALLWASFVLAGGCKCGPLYSVSSEGDCLGKLTVRGVACPEGSCTSLDAATTVTAVDLDGCEFVGWTGLCEPQRRDCAAAHARTARFERRAWPFHLDASRAAGLDVRVEPLGVQCASRCDMLVPVGPASVVATSSTGTPAVFSGECERIVSGRCEFESDRERHVTVTSNGVLVELNVVGPGRVSISTASVACGPDAQCSALVPTDSVVEATATPLDPNATVVWNDPGCAGLTCTKIASSRIRFAVTFIPRVRFSLQATGTGVGAVQFNGATIALPFVSFLEPGTRVTLRAQPSPDDVVAAFRGLPCETPRTVDTCSFTLAGATDGAVAFHRFIQWVVGTGPTVEISDVAARDAGLVIAVGYNGFVALPAWLPANPVGLGSAVAEVGADGGIGRVSAASGVGLRAPRFVTTPSAKLWVAGLLFRNAPGMPRTRVEWGSVDASVPDRAGDDVAFLDFDEAAFSPLQVVFSSATRADANADVGRGNCVAVGEDCVLGYSEQGGALDGGIPAPSSVSLGRWSNTWQRLSLDPVATDADFSLASDARGALMLFRSNPSVPAGTCQPSTYRAATIARLTTTGTCSSTQAVGSGSSVALSQLVTSSRGSVFAEASTSPRQGQRSWYALQSVDATFTTQWAQPIDTQEVSPTTPYELAPIRIDVSQRGIIALWAYRGSGAAAFQSNGLVIPCALSGVAPPTAQLVVTRHSADTGGLEWGVCLPAVDNGVRRFNFNTGVRGAPLLDGVAIATSAFPPSSAPTSFRIGTRSVAVSGVTHYLLFLTPP